MDSAGTTSATKPSGELSEQEKYHIERLQKELEECHEDDREAKGRILQAVAVLVTVLTVVYALVVAVGPESETPLSMKAVLCICLVVTVAAEIACLCYIVSIGVVQIVRSLYMGEVEKTLVSYDSVPEKDGGSAVGWLELCGTVNTLNPSRIYHRITAVHLTSTFGAMFGVTAVCLAFFVLFGFSLGNHGNLVFLAALVVIPFFVFMFWVLYSIAFRSDGLIADMRKVVRDNRTYESLEPFGGANTREVLERVYRIRCKRQMSKANIRWFIRYAVFPRLQDEPKGLFMLVGYAAAYGWLVVHEHHALNPIGFVCQLFYVWFVLDFLVFQVRYQINDIRGKEEDRQNPAKWRRHRLHSLLGDRNAPVRMSALVAGYRLLLACACMIANFLHMGIPIFLSTLAIALLAFLYEWLRTTESKRYNNWCTVRDASRAATASSRDEKYRSMLRPTLMKLVMSMGYVARFFYGAVCCVFCLQGQLYFSRPETILPAILDAWGAFWVFAENLGSIALAISLFGYAVASMIWSLEGASVIVQNAEDRYPKAHTVASARRLGALVWEARPIARARSLKYPWVSCMFAAVALLTAFALRRTAHTDGYAFYEAGACSLLLVLWYASLVTEGSFASVMRAARLLAAIICCSLLGELACAAFGDGAGASCVYLAFVSLAVGLAMLAVYGILIRSSYAMLNRFPSYQCEVALRASKRFVDKLFGTTSGDET